MSEGGVGQTLVQRNREEGGEMGRGGESTRKGEGRRIVTRQRGKVPGA